MPNTRGTSPRFTVVVGDLRALLAQQADGVGAADHSVGPWHVE